ncbi:MAG: hypothetical protein H0W06_04235 [Chloroflexia bacterium]|nr:hypothetical protein [Chloroflexia bacterium]
MSGGTQRRGEGFHRQHLGILAFGLLIRVALVPWGAFEYDIGAMREWTRQLVSAPLAEFYAAEMEVPPDHLPGDLWLLWLLGRGARLVAPGTDFTSDWYMAALKLVAVVADLLIGVLLFTIARGLAGSRRALIVAAAFVLNPAVIFVSAVWGQWDSVSMAVALAALLLLLRGRIAWALPVLAVAVLIKPQLALLGPLFVVYAVRRVLPATAPHIGLRTWLGGLRRMLPALVVGGAGSVLAALVLCLPFDVGLPGMPARWSILDRLAFAADRYPLTTYNAFNLWALPIGTAEAPDDSVEALFGFSASQIGLGLLLVAFAGALVGTALIEDREFAVLWGCLAAALAVFLLPTRVHERYLFPALVFVVLAWGLAPRLRWAALGLTLSGLANLYLVYAFWKPAIYPAILHTAWSVRGIALVNLAIFALVMVGGGRDIVKFVKSLALSRRVAHQQEISRRGSK